ncbi:MAG: hypothetical protein L0287_09040, partial [Anaerolineae bacterium]|nr:hypothetical protein [Anaerolineae bacterium]
IQIPHPGTTIQIPTPAVTTHYSLSAFDTSGNESLRSNTVTFSVADGSAPSAPSGLSIMTSLSDSWGEWAKSASCQIYLNGVAAMNGTFPVFATALRLAADGMVEIEGSGSSCGVPSNVWYRYNGTSFNQVS